MRATREAVQSGAQLGAQSAAHVGTPSAAHPGAGVVTVLMLVLLVGASGPAATEALCWTGAGADCGRSLAGVVGVTVPAASSWHRGPNHRDSAAACRWLGRSVIPIRTVADALLPPPRAPTDQHCV